MWFRFSAIKIKNNIDTTVIHEIIYEAVNHKPDENINYSNKKNNIKIIILIIIMWNMFFFLDCKIVGWGN